MFGGNEGQRALGVQSVDNVYDATDVAGINPCFAVMLPLTSALNMRTDLGMSGQPTRSVVQNKMLMDARNLDAPMGPWSEKPSRFFGACGQCKTIKKPLFLFETGDNGETLSFCCGFYSRKWITQWASDLLKRRAHSRVPPTIAAVGVRQSPASK